MILHIAGNNCELLAEKALYFPELHLLVVADLHLGKAAHFQSHGLAISNTVHQEDLNRLARLMEAFRIQKLIILGDLFHHGEKHGRELFSLFAQKYQHISIDWVLGNHDKSGKMELHNVRIHKEMQLENMQFVHESPSSISSKEYFVFSAHEHPAVKVQHKRSNLVLPCFIKENNQLILPSFGAFTGHKIYEFNQKTIQKHKQENRLFFVIIGKDLKQIG
jgi:DNA ligase-associated metallophosphoesterase